MCVSGPTVGFVVDRLCLKTAGRVLALFHGENRPETNIRTIIGRWDRFRDSRYSCAALCSATGRSRLYRASPNKGLFWVEAHSSAALWSDPCEGRSFFFSVNLNFGGRSADRSSEIAALEMYPWSKLQFLSCFRLWSFERSVGDVYGTKVRSTICTSSLISLKHASSRRLQFRPGCSSTNLSISKLAVSVVGQLLPIHWDVLNMMRRSLENCGAWKFRC